MREIRPEEACPCRSGATYGECHMNRRITARPAAITRRLRLRVIPEPDPDTRSVFMKPDGAPGSVFFAGGETTDAFMCGHCDAPLIIGLPLAPFQNLVLRCSQCGTHNETLMAGPPTRTQPAGNPSRRPKRHK